MCFDEDRECQFQKLGILSKYTKYHLQVVQPVLRIHWYIIHFFIDVISMLVISSWWIRNRNCVKNGASYNYSLHTIGYICHHLRKWSFMLHIEQSLHMYILWMLGFCSMMYVMIVWILWIVFQKNNVDHIWYINILLICRDVHLFFKQKCCILSLLICI